MTSEGQHGQPAEATSGDGFPPDTDGRRSSDDFPNSYGPAPQDSYGPPPQATPNGGSPFVVPAVPPFAQGATPDRYGVPATQPGSPPTGSARVPQGSARIPQGSDRDPQPTDDAGAAPRRPSATDLFRGPNAADGSGGSAQQSAWAPAPAAGPSSEANPFEPHPYQGSGGPLGDQQSDFAGFAPGSPTRGRVEQEPDDSGPVWGAGFGPDAESRPPSSEPGSAGRPPGLSAFGDQRVRVPGATLTGLPDAPPVDHFGEPSRPDAASRFAAPGSLPSRGSQPEIVDRSGDSGALPRRVASEDPTGFGAPSRSGDALLPRPESGPVRRTTDLPVRGSRPTFGDEPSFGGRSTPGESLFDPPPSSSRPFGSPTDPARPESGEARPAFGDTPFGAPPGSPTAPGSPFGAQPGSPTAPGSPLGAQPGSPYSAQPGSPYSAQPGSPFGPQSGSPFSPQSGSPFGPDSQRPDGQRSDGVSADSQRPEGQRPDGQRPEQPFGPSYGSPAAPPAFGDPGQPDGRHGGAYGSPAQPDSLRSIYGPPAAGSEQPENGHRSPYGAPAQTSSQPGDDQQPPFGAQTSGLPGDDNQSPRGHRQTPYTMDTSDESPYSRGNETPSDAPYGRPAPTGDDSPFGRPALTGDDSAYGRPATNGGSDSSYGHRAPTGEGDSPFGRSVSGDGSQFGRPDDESPYGRPASSGNDSQPASGGPYGRPAADGPGGSPFGRPPSYGDEDQAPAGGFAQRVPGASFNGPGAPSPAFGADPDAAGHPRGSSNAGHPGAANNGPGSTGSPAALDSRDPAAPRDPAAAGGPAKGTARPVSASASVPMASRVGPAEDEEAPPPAQAPQARVYGRPAQPVEDDPAPVSPFARPRTDRPGAGTPGASRPGSGGPGAGGRGTDAPGAGGHGASDFGTGGRGASDFGASGRGTGGPASSGPGSSGPGLDRPGSDPRSGADRPGDDRFGDDRFTPDRFGDGARGGVSQDLPPLGPKTPPPGGRQGPVRASASARVAPPSAPEQDSPTYNEFTDDVAGRARPRTPDSYGENTTDMAGRGQGPDQPYVPAPALPTLHARPPLVDGFPPAATPEEIAQQQSGISPDRPRLGGVFPGPATGSPSGPGSYGGPGSPSGPGNAGGPGIGGPGNMGGPGNTGGPGNYGGPSTPSGPGNTGAAGNYGGPGPGNQSRPTVTPPGPDETASWPGPDGAVESDQGRFDQFKPDAEPAAPKPDTPHVRMLPVLLGVILGAALLVGVSIGVVWLIARGSDTGFSASAGDCVKRSGDEAVKANCADAGTFKVVSKVDTKEQCPDPGQPYVLNPTSDGKTQVLCLKPN